MLTKSRRSRLRSGKVLVCLAVLLPTLIGVISLVIDGSLLFAEARQLQHVADAAAQAAARELQLGHPELAESVAHEYVEQHNGLPEAITTVSVPPTQGPYAGNANFAEVIVSRNVDTYLLRALGRTASTISVRSVAGFKPSTAGIAVAVLDPDPPDFSLAPLSFGLPSLTSLLGGLEVLGLGEVQVQGAVAVNTTWGGQDENGNPAGSSAGPPYAVSCTPVLPLTRMRAKDIRVVGGVDNPANYVALKSSDPSPLRANRLPIPDPYAGLPAPTLANAPGVVTATNYGHVSVTGVPVIGPPVTLNPGVYDSIQVVSGIATFTPGIYVIRSVNPATGIALNLVGGTITAQGVMFYITNSSYSVETGMPDASDATDDSHAPPAVGLTNVSPSVAIDVGLFSGSFSPLAAGSSFDGMLIYQRRDDRRPIVIVKQSLVGNATMAGTIYAKWGHLFLVCNGTLETRFAVGSLRFANALKCTIAPSALLPPAKDVYLVE